MDEKKWLYRAAILIVVLSILNLIDMLRPVWLLAATIFSIYLLIHDWLSQQVVNRVNAISKNYVLSFVLIIFIGIFGYIAVNTNIDVALKNSEHFSGRINDTLALAVLGITLALYIRK